MTTPISDAVVARLRTYVPFLWGHLAGWLIGIGLPASFVQGHDALASEVLALVLTAAWYELWNFAVRTWPSLPAWLGNLTTGQAVVPTYTPPLTP